MRRTQRLGHSSRLNYTRPLASLPCSEVSDYHTRDGHRKLPSTHGKWSFYKRDFSHKFPNGEGRDDRHGYTGRGGKESRSTAGVYIFQWFGAGEGSSLRRQGTKSTAFVNGFCGCAKTLISHKVLKGSYNSRTPISSRHGFIVKTTTVSDGLRSPNFRSCSMKTNLANAQWFVLNRSKNPTCDNKIRMPRTTLMNRDLCHTNQQSRSSILQLHASVYTASTCRRNTVHFLTVSSAGTVFGKGAYYPVSSPPLTSMHNFSKLSGLSSRLRIQRYTRKRLDHISHHSRRCCATLRMSSTTKTQVSTQSKLHKNMKTRKREF